MLQGWLHTLQVPTLFGNLNFLLGFYNHNEHMPCTKMSFFFWAHLRVMNLWHAYLKQNECNVLYAGGHLQCENSRYTSSFLMYILQVIILWVQWVFKDFQEVTVCRLLATVKKRQWFCLSTTAIDTGPCVSKWMMCVCVQPGVVPLLSSVVQWPHLQHKTLPAGKKIFSSMSTWYS